ncbi:MAG: hypothetical protein IIW73_04870 [Clostridia bacterium]|nr:hypothetical protein [Clostridia bacterium]
MGEYLGFITIRNRYVNFKPLFEYVDDEFRRMTSYDRQALLPESQFEDINFYCEDGHDEDFFVDGEYCLLTLEDEDLEDNISYGVRNPTGYKINISPKMDNGEIRSLSEVNRYLLLTKSRYDGSYKTNPKLIIKDSCVYAGLKVVILDEDNPNTVIGPFTVEQSDGNDAPFIRTGLQAQKYILWGYKYPTYLDQYGISLGRYGDQRTYIKVDDSVCTRVPIDVITKAQLLTAFRDAIGQEYFVDGKIDLSQIDALLKAQESSLFVGEQIPEAVQTARFESLSNLLTDEENLNETFGFISSTITALLEKYQGDPQYNHLVERLANDPDFLSRIQRFHIISEKIKAEESKLRELSGQVDALQQQLAQQPQREYAEGLLAEYEEKIQELRREKAALEADITSLLASHKEFSTLAELEQQVSHRKLELRDIERDTDALDRKLGRIFDDAAEKAANFAFDGMLFNKMLRKAAEWENAQNAADYSAKETAFMQIPLSSVTGADLIDHLVAEIQALRPNYDRNTILNILICYTQGFLTVFSGEPGTGKTSICKILASVLGLSVPEKTLPAFADGYVPTRFIPVSVEKGWTTKRDFIGYYNPLTKSFDRSNRRIFDALNILDIEARGTGADLPFAILLDEANLSPMEYYWADYMNLCDELDSNSVINLGDNFCFSVPTNLRFVATINNDDTTESLSPRLIDRAWIIRLPKARSGMAKPVKIRTSGDMIAWSALVHTFGTSEQNYTEMSGVAKSIYEELLGKCRTAKINVSTRVDNAIRMYWSAAQRLFESSADTDASISALDYAVAQRILPHIDGSGVNFGERLKEIQQFCSDKNLRLSAEILQEIIHTGIDSMQYYHFFA